MNLLSAEIKKSSLGDSGVGSSGRDGERLQEILWRIKEEINKIILKEYTL